jgi:NAD(P)-dependent dehydrogenase (short-subunit alcohol dehydrogenase family)
MRLQPGQVAVVTGAASGIGFALAQAFAGRGLGVVLADVHPESLEAATDALRAEGARVYAAVTDVRQPGEVQDLADVTLRHFGRVDVVCNNAGVAGPFGWMWEQSPDTWTWMLDVALLGVVHGIRSFVPLLLERGSGHVLNTASVGGLTPLPKMAPYNAAKHAVVALSETLSAELAVAGPGVGVSVLCPGLVDTPLPATSARHRPPAVPAGGADQPTEMSSMARPGHALMQPAEVARAALDGIESNRLHIITHRDSAGPVRARVEALLADLPTPPELVG